MIIGNNLVRRRLAVIVLIAACVGLPGTLAAETGSARRAAQWDVQQLMRTLAEVKSAKGKFVERKYLSMLNAPLEFSGALIYTAPGRLEKNTLLPKPERLLLDEDQLTIEYPAKNQRRTLSLPDYPVIWALVEGIRSTLAGDLPTLTRFYRLKLDGGADRWRLLLTPIEPKMQMVVSEIRIGGNNARIATIEIIETEGDRSVMTVVPVDDEGNKNSGNRNPS